MDKLITFFTQSSEDPGRTSATLTGILIGGAAWIHQYLDVIPFVHNLFVSPLGQQIDPILTSIGTIVGTGWCLFGLLRKLTNKVESVNGLRVE